MGGSELILDYCGPVDLPEIESLILELKSSKDFINLQTLKRKRTYSLFVECLENIYKHSALKKSNDRNVQPHISVMDNKDQIVIRSGNPILEENRDKLIRKLDRVNTMAVDELREMHEIRISTKSLPEENGAGLGFICIGFKSGNKLNYSFRPLIPGFLYFELQISLNK